MKKAFKICGIVVIAFVAILIVLPLAFKGKVDEIIKKEANEMLNAKFDYSNLGISLIKHFPNASLNLKGLSIIGINEFEGDTLIAAKEISLVVNTFSIFKDSGIEVKKILVAKPEVYAHVLSDGKPNWDIMKEDSSATKEEETSQDSSFKLLIDKFKISDARVRYLDEQGKMEYKTYPLNALLKGNMHADVTTLDINATAENSYYNMDSQTYLNGQTLGVNGLIEADLGNNKYSFTNTNLMLNAINMGLNGNVLLADEYIDVDLKADCNKVNFKDILSLIPAVYTNDFKNLTANGDLSLAAWVKGRVQGDNIPAFALKMLLNNGSFKYAQLPKSVTDIFIDLAVENAGGSVDATKIDLSKLSMLMAGNKLDAALKLSTPISNPNFDAVVKGIVDFSQIKQIYPLPDTINLSGKVNADFAAKGTMAQIEKEQYEQMSAKGSIIVNDFEAKIGQMPKVLINNAQVNITPKELIVKEFTALIGKSDISFAGGLQNYIAYVLKSSTLKGNLDVKSNLLDLNEMFSLSPSTSDNAQQESQQEIEQSSDTSAILIPKNIDFVLNTQAKEILFNKIILKDLVGKITVKDGIASLNNLNMNAFDGKLDVSGVYSCKDETKPLANLDLSFKDASFQTTFNQLDMVKKIVPLFEKTGGDYSMKMNLSTALTSNMEPIIPTLNAHGVLTTSNINIQNVKVFNALAEALKDEKLKNWEIKDAVIIKFTIKDGKVNTNPFDVKVGNVKMTLSGETSLNSEIDYTAKVNLPDNKFLNTANVKIGGTFTSPKISLDVKDAATSVVNNILEEKLGKDATQISQDIQKKIDDLRNSATAAGDKLISEAEKQKQALIDKANNQIAKIAAEKAGNKIIDAAKKEKQKLLDKAEEQIKQLQGK